VAVLCTGVLAACDGWNEERASFESRAQFLDSRYADALPSNLLPPSARNIEFKRNIDSTVVEASFDFADGERESLVRPFLSFDQLRLRLALADAGATNVPLPSLLLRCGEGPMEFLEIRPAGHARYWTDWDKTRRARACSNGASRSPGSV